MAIKGAGGVDKPITVQIRERQDASGPMAVNPDSADSHRRRRQTRVADNLDTAPIKHIVGAGRSIKPV